MKKLFEIKVCGINDQISMDAAVNNSVNYIGLVFYNDSPRNISISRISGIENSPILTKSAVEVLRFELASS